MSSCKTRLFGAAASGAMMGLLWVSAVAATSPDACAVVTQAEVAAALGVPVNAGERVVPSDTTLCTWHEQRKNQVQGMFVTIAFLEEQAYQMRKMTRTLNNAPEGGIGDDAYFSKDKSMPFPTLTVKKGGTYFEVTAVGHDRASVRGKGDDPDQKDKDVDRAIARLILKKL